MTDDALLSTPAGRYGAGYGDPVQHLGTGGPVYHDEHYEQFRREHERELDEAYQAWRRSRFGSAFEQWRRSRLEATVPHTETPLQSLGRAVSDTVTGTQTPDLDKLSGQ